MHRARVAQAVFLRIICLNVSCSLIYAGAAENGDALTDYSSAEHLRLMSMKRLEFDEVTRSSGSAPRDQRKVPRRLYELQQDTIYNPFGASTLLYLGTFLPNYFRANVRI